VHTWQVEFAAFFSFAFCYLFMGEDWEIAYYVGMVDDAQPFQQGTEAMLAVFFVSEFFTEAASTLVASRIIKINRVSLWPSIPKDILVTITMILGYMGGGCVSLVIFLKPHA
jgi:hypothetical protein